MLLAGAGAGAGTTFLSTDGGTSWAEVAALSGCNVAAMAASADGQRLVAAAQDDYVYVSTNGGLSWVQRGCVQPWAAVACSADGMRLGAAAYGGMIWTSTDGGASWSAA
ncbi:hypothetical protein ABPG75_011119 [Micractinium tetrahymenae]